MENWIFELLVCPYCGTNDTLEVSSGEIDGKTIIDGSLSCSTCNRTYPIVNGIPRFVEEDDNYAENFGYQWHLFRGTQIDRMRDHNLSGSRLLKDTRWKSEWISGKLILDAGCGAGRFADELAQNGARVVACDLSSAVDACKQIVDDPRGYSQERGKIAIVQANLLALPFKEGIFDAVHCAGVIQHTPAPERVMRTLPRHLKSGGKLFYNFYEINLSSKFQIFKYSLRRWTPKWRMQTLVWFSRILCLIFFPLSWVMSRIPVVRFFNQFLPICSVHPAGVPLSQQFDLTLLDTIDWYGPLYEIRQDHRDVSILLTEEGLDEVKSEAGLAWAIKH